MSDAVRPAAGETGGVPGEDPCTVTLARLQLWGKLLMAKNLQDVGTDGFRLGGVGVVAGRKDDDVDGGAIGAGAGRRMEPTHS
ncbi:MAG: hypothetical protein INH40_14645 [Acidobacteriaceae bacterium]|nr:hypothetical protein [Acidobacteriaceae bacterium]